jgi:hypothetical protein
MRNYTSTFAVAICALLCLGCGPKMAAVSGSVTIDGKAVETGTIAFVPSEGKDPPASTAIQNGKYEVKTTPGKKKVQISATVVTEKRDGIEFSKELLGPDYNSATNLEYEVKSGSQTKDWETKSAPSVGS